MVAAERHRSYQTVIARRFALPKRANTCPAVEPITRAGPAKPVIFEAKLMTRNFIFAQDVILDPDTGKILAVVRNGGVWRDGARIAVLVGEQMYDLNGNLLGKLAAGAGSLPISFKNLVEGKSAHAERALVA